MQLPYMSPDRCMGRLGQTVDGQASSGLPRCGHDMGRPASRSVGWTCLAARLQCSPRLVFYTAVAWDMTQGMGPCMAFIWWACLVLWHPRGSLVRMGGLCRHSYRSPSSRAVLRRFCCRTGMGV